MEPNYISAAEFLTSLPRSNLDDREFDDLVNECLLRIPRYCPEWTNHNPGDPGVTLIELFAWLVHQMLYRFNQVPRRHYVAFLEVLGLRLAPPAPARTEVTFYLTRDQAEPKAIPAGTEVATERTESQAAIVFTTEKKLVIGTPEIRHLFLGGSAPDGLSIEQLSRPFDVNNLGANLELFQSCTPKNCFYLVLAPTAVDNQDPANELTPDNKIEGNVLALRFKGPRAETTGIAPDNPPLEWQVWTEDGWQRDILRAGDDKTRGFSFDRLGQAGPNPDEEGADVILHLPQQWPSLQVGDYEGHWLRCVYTDPDYDQGQSGYDRSPIITEVTARTLGGTVTVSECVPMAEELLGKSNGKAGQVFALEGKPVIARHRETHPEEHIVVRLPNGQSEPWEEVEHFGDSSAADRHYMIDSASGLVQFGPLIREPEQGVRQTQDRGQSQAWGREPTGRRSPAALPPAAGTALNALERQYGAVPPLGAEIVMARYRVGGGTRGNVPANQIRVLKTAIPYVKRVVNFEKAKDGKDAESLDDAVMRVPALLRTRKTALTPEEFEQATRQFWSVKNPSWRVHRAHCVTAPHLATPGIVHILVIPYPASAKSPLDLARGLHPKNLVLPPKPPSEESSGQSPNQLSGQSPNKPTTLTTALQSHLDDHKALGIRVKPDSPTYVGVRARVEVVLTDIHRTAEEQTAVGQELATHLYRWFNPIVGGPDGEGWPLGRSIRVTDVITQLQSQEEVQYVGEVQLYSYRRNGDSPDTWVQVSGPEVMIPLGPMEVACSWAEEGAGHEIILLDP